jgi:hypothetical protein
MNWENVEGAHSDVNQQSAQAGRRSSLQGFNVEGLRDRSLLEQTEANPYTGGRILSFQCKIDAAREAAETAFRHGSNPALALRSRRAPQSL